MSTAAAAFTRLTAVALLAIATVVTIANAECPTGHSATCPSNSWSLDGTSEEIDDTDVTGCAWYCKCQSCFACDDGNGNSNADVLVGLSVASAAGTIETLETIVSNFISSRYDDALSHSCHVDARKSVEERRLVRLGEVRGDPRGESLVSLKEGVRSSAASRQLLWGSASTPTPNPTPTPAELLPAGAIIGLWNPSHERFITMTGDSYLGKSDQSSNAELPDEWGEAFFQVVDAGNDKIALWNLKEGRFLKMDAHTDTNGGKIQKTGPQQVTGLNSNQANAMFEVVFADWHTDSDGTLMPMIGLFSSHRTRFIRMPNADNIDRSGVRSDGTLPDSWAWERFVVAFNGDPSVAADPADEGACCSALVNNNQCSSTCDNFFRYRPRNGDDAKTEFFRNTFEAEIGFGSATDDTNLVKPCSEFMSDLSEHQQESEANLEDWCNAAYTEAQHTNALTEGVREVIRGNISAQLEALHDTCSCDQCACLNTWNVSVRAMQHGSDCPYAQVEVKESSQGLIKLRYDVLLTLKSTSTNVASHPYLISKVAARKDGPILMRKGMMECSDPPPPPPPNIFETDAMGVGGWGGSCTCPNGEVYNVGDNGDGCGSLACIGGTPGQCNSYGGVWSGNKVSCAVTMSAAVMKLIVNNYIGKTLEDKWNEDLAYLEPVVRGAINSVRFSILKGLS